MTNTSNVTYDPAALDEQYTIGMHRLMNSTADPTMREQWNLPSNYSFVRPEDQAKYVLKQRRTRPRNPKRS